MTQAAEKGKANRALRDYLAQVLQLNRSQVQLLCGETSRQKKFLIRGVTQDELRQHLRVCCCAKCRSCRCRVPGGGGRDPGRNSWGFTTVSRQPPIPRERARSFGRTLLLSVWDKWAKLKLCVIPADVCAHSRRSERVADDDSSGLPFPGRFLGWSQEGSATWRSVEPHRAR